MCYQGSMQTQARKVGPLPKKSPIPSIQSLPGGEVNSMQQPQDLSRGGLEHCLAQLPCSCCRQAALQGAPHSLRAQAQNRAMLGAAMCKDLNSSSIFRCLAAPATDPDIQQAHTSTPFRPDWCCLRY